MTGAAEAGSGVEATRQATASAHTAVRPARMTRARSMRAPRR